MSEGHQGDIEHKRISARATGVQSPAPEIDPPAYEAASSAIQLARLNPRLLTASTMLALQRTVGNSIVAQLQWDRRQAATPQRKAEAVRSATPAAYPLSANTSLGPWQPDRTVSASTRGPAAPVISRFWNLAWDTLSGAQQGVRTAVNGAANEKAVYAGGVKGSLSAALQAGLTLAQANPDAAPAEPAWLSVQVKKLDNAGNYFLTKQKKHVIQPMFPTAYKKQWRAMWAHGHNNNEGNKPGVAGAGGYKEYYAEPDPDAATWWDTDKGTFPLGKNRILQQTNSSDGLKYWWASTDHYTTATFISDA
jgi:hypothetical protein